MLRFLEPYLPSYLRAPAPFEPPTYVYLLMTTPVKLLLYILYHTINLFRLAPLAHPSSPVRFVCISDTHDLIPSSLPAGDVLIHAGDLTNDGDIPSLQAQIDWLDAQPHRYKIAIAGNHDTYLDARTRPSLSAEQRKGELDWKSVIYLQHSSVTLKFRRKHDDGTKNIPTDTPTERCLTLHGSPQIPACGPKAVFAFQYDRALDAWTDTLPSETDVLITHTPPRQHRDLSLLGRGALGCAFLRREVRRVRPALHVFGHVHWGAGQEVCFWDEGQAAYERGMERGEGWTRGLADGGLWGEVLRVLVFGVLGVVWERVWGGVGEGEGRSTRCVNAAVVKGNTGRLGGEVQVVVI